MSLEKGPKERWSIGSNDVAMLRGPDLASQNPPRPSWETSGGRQILPLSGRRLPHAEQRGRERRAGRQPQSTCLIFYRYGDAEPVGTGGRVLMEVLRHLQGNTVGSLRLISTATGLARACWRLPLQDFSRLPVTAVRSTTWTTTNYCVCICASRCQGRECCSNKTTFIALRVHGAQWAHIHRCRALR